ncbi:LysR family transcriptional regulator [Tateyamaria sp. ANG-S1]|uniref:LysR family transcriptional regulator n=1 Tax=Tateyamaria sp. ANG-S1 TaxID=1577905 RepID=UPI00057FD587|nr:LysR family transcriptional regulator [Tateyamaria sp. ANG-S1]KIC49075.1 LysR family transcriptional regulator [Tateyamaria sp. ANG-S1]
MPPHWDDLRLFLAVARAETLSAAAKAVRKDAATLGRRVARLERDLDVVLFRKSPQGYALTEAGVRLRDRAEAAEVALRAATEGIAGAGQAEVDAGLTGQVRIGAPDGCANYVLPQVCAALAGEHPGLDIQIVALPRVFNLSRREADLAIGVSAPTAGQLTVQRITDYRLHFAASQSYLADAPPLDALDDLHHHRVVGYIPDMIFDRELDYLADAGVSRVALASNSVAVQLNMLRQGGGVGVVHDFALPFAPGLRRVLNGDFSLSRSFYLIRHQSDTRDARLNRVAELLVHAVRTEVMRLEGLI